jgi:integrase
VDFWANGKQHQESTHTTDYKEAERYLKRRQGEVAAGLYLGLKPERVRFQELSELVVDDYIRNEKASLSWVQRRLKLHLLPALGNIRAADFGSSHIHRYIDQRRKENASTGSINRELAVLKRVFNLAIQHDPPLIVRKPTIKTLPENNVRTGFLEEYQYLAVREALPEEIRLLFVVAYHTGARIGELKKMLWRQVDLWALEIRLDPGTTKNREGRILPIYGDMVEWLKIEKEIRDQNYPDCPYVFRRGNKPIKNFRKSWKTACALAGVPNLIIHDLRRTAVRLMSRAGERETVIRKITGHKTSSIFHRYNIVSQGDLTLFRARMNAHVGRDSDGDRVFGPQIASLEVKNEPKHVLSSPGARGDAAEAGISTSARNPAHKTATEAPVEGYVSECSQDKSQDKSGLEAKPGKEKKSRSPVN